MLYLVVQVDSPGDGVNFNWSVEVIADSHQEAAERAVMAQYNEDKSNLLRALYNGEDWLASLGGSVVVAVAPGSSGIFFPTVTGEIEYWEVEVTPESTPKSKKVLDSSLVVQ